MILSNMIQVTTLLCATNQCQSQIQWITYYIIKKQDSSHHPIAFQCCYNYIS